MPAWLKQGRAPAGPPAPGHVDQAVLLEEIAEKERLKIATPAMAFMREKVPAQQLDKWGQPLPMSAYDQEQLDQLFAIVASPYDRGRALLHAGMIAPQEVDALIRVYPEIVGVLDEEVLRDMLANPPPYPSWSEAILGVWFGVPAPDVWNQGTPKAPERSQSLQGPAKKGTEAEVPSTPSERREVAVREMRS